MVEANPGSDRLPAYGAVPTTISDGYHECRCGCHFATGRFRDSTLEKSLETGFSGWAWAAAPAWYCPINTCFCYALRISTKERGYP